MSQGITLITGDQFRIIFPHANNPDDFAAAINMQLPSLPVADDAAAGAFLVFMAQTSYETAHYAQLEENLNYSAASLLREWPSHFSPADAQDYQHQPERIANRAYANRLGNGNEASGDGWTYRGRGVIQLTGRDNYQKFADHISMELDSVIPYLMTPAGAVATAIWYWQEHHLINYTTRDSMITATKIINGSDATNPLRLVEYDRIAAGLGLPSV